MKIVKAALAVAVLFINLILTLFALNPVAASAEDYSGKYGYADLGASVAFCSEKNGSSMLFLVPETYCVKVLYQDGDWLRVTYGADEEPYRALEGYVLPDGLIFADEPPEHPYLNLTFKVVFSAASDSGYLPGLDDLEIDAAYYGAYPVGTESYSYVRCNGKFGYVSKSIGSVPKNPLPSKPTVADPGDGATGVSSTPTVIVAAVLAGVAAITVIILFFTSRKPKE